MRRSLAAGLVSVATLVGTGHAVAQTPAAASSDQSAAQAQFYTPKLPTVTTPIRAEVLTATSFRDPETGTVYRLYGVDACDLSQTAVLGRQSWPCGVVAMAWLVNATLNKWITCTPIRVEATTQVSRCATSDYVDVAGEMLRNGLALTTRDAADQLIPSYKQIEADARKAFRGLWGSQFQMPWDFRAAPRAAP
jgi:endonuclease YncB( thermonuclease family)